MAKRPLYYPAAKWWACGWCPLLHQSAQAQQKSLDSWSNPVLCSNSHVCWRFFPAQPYQPCSTPIFGRNLDVAWNPTKKASEQNLALSSPNFGLVQPVEPPLQPLSSPNNEPLGSLHEPGRCRMTRTSRGISLWWCQNSFWKWHKWHRFSS